MVVISAVLGGDFTRLLIERLLMTRINGWCSVVAGDGAQYERIQKQQLDVRGFLHGWIEGAPTFRQ